jgi:4-hydroxy-tetrahydrodipicolinate reductase
MTKVKVVQVGAGKMSKYTMKYASDVGYQIVGAVDINPDVIGKDIGEVMETSVTGVKVDSLRKLDTILDNTKPDICIVTTMSLLNDIKDVVRTIVNHKVNVITTCEEAFFASNSNAPVFKELDILAKANGVTITGCGYQDVFWGNLIATIAGSTHNMNMIKGSSSYNVEDYGIALAKAHGAGMTTEEFDSEIASVDNISEEERQTLINNGEFLPSYMWNTVGWLVDKFNLTITDMVQKCVPIIAKEDIYSKTLQMDIKKGNVLGMSAVVTAHTKENVTIEAECIGKVYEEDEFDKNEWTVYGEPDTTVVVNRPDTVELTCADIVNRIPDVLASEPGFVSTSKMGIAKYQE